MAGLVGAALAHPQYDWMFFTTPQENANNRPIFIPRGKGVGGSSQVFLPHDIYNAFILIVNN